MVLWELERFSSGFSFEIARKRSKENLVLCQNDSPYVANTGLKIIQYVKFSILNQTRQAQFDRKWGIFHSYSYIQFFFIFSKNINLQKVLMNIINISNTFQKVSNTSIIKRRFQIGPVKCHYQGTNQVDHQPVRPHKETLSVINVLCQRDGNKLHKVLKIEYGQNIITIKDQYDLDISITFPKLEKREIIEEKKLPQAQIVQIDSQQSQQSKIFQEQSEVKNHNNNQHRKKNNLHNTEGQLTDKNTNKNILRAFYQYCRRYGSNQQKQDIKPFINNNSFTNAIVLDIINNEYLSPLFQRFLRYEFDRWVNVSRVKNKEGHQRRATSFLRIIQNAHLSNTD